MRTGDMSRPPYAASSTLEQFDAGGVIAGGSESSITGDERDTKSFAERHERCIVGGEVMTQLPHAVRQWVMWVAHDGEIGEIQAGVGSAFLRQLGACDQPAQHMKHLDIDEMRSMKVGVVSEAF